MKHGRSARNSVSRILRFYLFAPTDVEQKEDFVISLKYDNQDRQTWELAGDGMRRPKEQAVRKMVKATCPLRHFRPRHLLTLSKFYLGRS